MAKKTDEKTETSVLQNECYGETVDYAGLEIFLKDALALDSLAEQHGWQRFATSIWGAAGIGKCVSGDALIRTNRGVIEIRELFDGDPQEGWLKAPDGLTVETPDGLMPVAKLYYSGVKKSIKMITDFGRTLTGSTEHPVVVLTADGFHLVKMSDLKIGDTVVLSNKPANISQENLLPSLDSIPAYYNVYRDFQVPQKMSQDLAYILGCLIGEGNTKDNSAISLTQSKDKPLIKNFLGKFKQLFGLDFIPTPDKRTLDTVTYRCSRVLLVNWFRSIGLDSSYSCEKTIPWSVLRSSPENQLAFVAALYEAEGHRNSGGIGVSSASKRLLEQISHLLLQWNIQTTMRERVINGTNYYELTCFSYDAIDLQKLIGFSRIKDLSSWVNKKKNPNKGLIPTDKAEWSFSDTLTRLIGLRFERIVSLADNGEIPLYDVCMDTPTHQFVVNGFICHNTSVVKQLAKNPIEWNGEQYPGYAIHDVPLAQFEEMGDLHGLPCKHVLMRNNGSRQWVPIEVMADYVKLEWRPDVTEPIRTMYAPPDWVPVKPGPSILIFDDWTRASLRIIKGVMQLIQNYGMISWRLPPGCHIVLTSNPDEQDYLVTSIDDAIRTRLRSVTLGWKSETSAKTWAMWADRNDVDGRIISFVLRYPEMAIGPARTNPRTIAEFGRALGYIGGIEEGTDRRIRASQQAKAFLDNDTISTLFTFLSREIEDIIEPEQILTGAKEAINHTKDLMCQGKTKRKEPRIDIVSIILERLMAYCLNPAHPVTEQRIKNFQEYILTEGIPEDLRHSIMRRMATYKDGTNQGQQWLIGNEQLVKEIIKVTK